MKYIIISLLIILTQSCSKKYDLKDATRIYEKLIVFEAKGISAENTIVINGKEYVIEEKVCYNNEGNCSFFYRGGSEGFIQYSRKSLTGFLPLEKEQLNYKIKIDKKDNLILDNDDTISAFKVLKEEIMVDFDSTNRLYIYKYK